MPAAIEDVHVDITPGCSGSLNEASRVAEQDFAVSNVHKGGRQPDKVGEQR